MLARLLAKIFIKNNEDTSNPLVQQKYSKLANIFFMILMGSMGIVKFTIGRTVGSIAISSSAFADFSDVGLALMMMISYKLSAKAPDAKHPFGYARVEYVTGMIVSLIILALGFELLISSIEKIMHPEAPEANAAAYTIMAVSVVINATVFSVNRAVSKIIKSVTLKAASTKNIIDGLASLVVLASLIVYSIWGVDFDGYIGLLMAGLVLYSAVESFKDTVNPLLGLVPDLEFSREIRDKILSYPRVIGIHNEIIHNYGNNRCYVSVHAEFSKELSAIEIHQAVCDIEQDFLFEGIILTIHFDLVETQDKELDKINLQLHKISSNLKYKVKISDLKIMPADDITYLFFTVTVPRSSKHEHVDAQTIRADFSRELSHVDQSLHAAITVNYSHISG